VIIHETKSSSQRLLRAILGEGHYIFDSNLAKQIAKKLGIQAANTTRLLSSLVNQGWLIRLKRGLYAGTGQLPGQFEIPPFVIATHLISPAAISHWSALNYHGFTEQIPQRITAMTPQKITFPTQYQPNKTKPYKKHVWEVGGIYYEYINVKPECFFGIDKIWLDEYFCVEIVDKERAVLELFASIRYFGGIGEVLGIMKSSFGEINLKQLIQYAIQYNNAAVIKRLGWTLEYLKITIAEIEALHAFPIKGFRLLDPTRPKTGLYNKRWMILNNLTGSNQ